VTFFFDNTFPPQLVKILKILNVDARHLQDDFPADTDDVDWLPEVGRKGWVVVTGDRKISKKPPERKA
jgi:predicted nuclease of predicted toxin-antitoxin system